MMKLRPTSFFNVNYGWLLIAALSVTATAAFFGYAERSSGKEAVASPASLGKLAFDRTSIPTSGTSTITIASTNADGTGLTTLAAATVPPLANVDPSWKPDGTKVVYDSDADIWVMNADGSNKVNLTNNGSTSLERDPSWSVNGKIAYVRDSFIWTMNEDGSSQSTLPFMLQFPNSPAFSPDGTKLAFQSLGDIWFCNANGTDAHRVTDNNVAESSPAWSPDSTKIVFAKNGVGITVIDLNGTNEIALTSSPQDVEPSWSSDGTKIAFNRKGTSANGIYTMDAAGGNQIAVVPDVPTQPGRVEHSSPTWQPVAVAPNTVIISGRVTRNGESLAGVTVNLTGAATSSTVTNQLGEYRFENISSTGTYTVTPTLADHIFAPVRRIFENPAANQIADFAAGQTCSTPNCRVNGKVAFERGSDIYVSNADGSGVTLQATGGINTDPSFSPDGKFITYRSNLPGNYEIYRVSTGGTGAVRLTTNSASDETPVFSPDGTKIVFTSDRDGNIDIYSMNAADGSNQVRLTNNASADKEPVFSADGTKIAFTRPYDGTGRTAIYTMNAADGSNVLQITTPSTAASIYDQTPTFSPDGTKLLFWRLDTGPFTSVFFIANADGSNPVSTGITGFVYKPSFSPDGTKIIYSRLFSPGTYNIEYATIGGGPGGVIVQNGHHPDWQPVRPATRSTAFDFDGDGRSDLSIFRPSNQLWYLQRSDAGFAAFQWGIGTDTITPADYDGDQKTDIAVWRESSGDFYILNSSTSTARSENLGISGDVPAPQDWDGDGKADLSVYRTGAQGTYYYRASAGNPNRNLTFVPWGISGDKPVSGDFDGDGRADAGVYRPSNGVWYIRKSYDGQLSATAFGLAGDKLVPADYDGDGKTDQAVYRSGIWYLLRSTDGFTAFQYGIANDIPVPADYDGDGKANAAVFRDGIWYRLNPNASSVIDSFGIAGDKPGPSAYVR